MKGNAGSVSQFLIASRRLTGLLLVFIDIPLKAMSILDDSLIFYPIISWRMKAMAV